MADTVWLGLIFAAVFTFLLVFLGTRHRKEFGELIPSLKGLKVGPGGISIEFYEKAVLQKEGKRPPRRQSKRTLGRIGAGRILWVDDDPQNNELEIAALRERGVEVDCAASNEEALDLATADPDAYGLVISDVDRGDEGEKAGLELPPRLRAVGVRAPIAFYVGRVDRPTTDLGDPVFAAPSKLFEYIGNQLGPGGEEEGGRG